MSTMGKWQIKDVSAGTPSAEPEHWDVLVELEHADDGRRLQVALDAEVRCDITLDGEAIGFEGFLSDAGADFEREVDRLTEDGVFTEEEVLRALGRDYWAHFTSSTITAIAPEAGACYVGEPEEVLSGAFNIDYDGEAFDASGWLTDGLEAAIERALRSAARSEVAHAEYWAGEAYSALIENGERTEH